MTSYEKQLEFFSKDNEKSLTFVVGEKGIGKTHFIHNYYKERKNILYIREQTFNSYFLEPIINTIAEFENNTEVVQDNLNMPDAVRKKLLDICKLDNIVICFESFNSYQENMAEFCFSFFQSYLDSEKYSAFILIELDSDASAYADSVTKRLYTLTAHTNFINFNKRTKEELFKIISENFYPELDIQEKDQNYIIKSSFGNISYLLIIINYLKQEGYIIFDGCKWICNGLPNGILNQTVEDYIKQRYERLNPALKNILQKSSLLGAEFYTIQLRDSFNIVRAETELTKIERISALIKKIDMYDNSKFLFETEEVCYNIQNLIPKDEKKSWNKMLAEYYEVQFHKHEQTLFGRLENCCRLAIYYENCEDIERSILFYIRAIRYSIYLLDFKHALALVSSVKENHRKHLNNRAIYSEVLKWEAYCYHELGKYTDATVLFAKLLKDSTFTESERIEINYYYADSLYFIGKVSKALDVLLEIKDELQSGDNSKLLFKVLGELATVYGFYRDYRSAKKYFGSSVNQCNDAGLKHDYYVQLRKSSMFWDLQITTPLMEQAAAYFEDKNNIQELAKTYHNLGADSLYLGKEPEAISYLNQAVEAFQKYGSDEIHYTYNCLGIYYAAYKQDYEKAISYFKKSLSFEPVLFSAMVLNINMASCYKALHDNDATYRYLNKAILLQKDLGMEIPSYLIYLLINQGIFAKIDGCTKESEQYFRKSLECKLNRNQLYLVGKNLSDILDETDTTISEYASYRADPLYDRFCQNNLCLSTLRFWE